MIWVDFTQPKTLFVRFIPSMVLYLLWNINKADKCQFKQPALINNYKTNLYALTHDTQYTHLNLKDYWSIPAVTVAL